MSFIRADLKNAAKEQLRGKWNYAVLVVFIYTVIVGVVSVVFYQLQSNEMFSPVPFINLLSILVTAPLMIGMIMYFFAIAGNAEQPEVTLMFQGFSYYGKSIGISLWTTLWVILWSLLFIVPGIIKAIAYSQAFYVIAENPDVKVVDALKTSIKMTNGNKGMIFVMYLSFIGWALIGALTLGIGYLWLGPYMTTTFCNMYLKLKEISLMNGICLPSDFMGAKLKSK